MKICFFVLSVMAASSCTGNSYHRGNGPYGGGGYPGGGPIRTVRVVLPNGVGPGGFGGPGQFHGLHSAGNIRTIRVVLHPGSFGGSGGYDGSRGPIGSGAGGGVKIIKIIRQQSGGHEGINGGNGHVRTIRLIRQQAGGFGGNVGSGGRGGEVKTIKLIRQQAGGAGTGGHGGHGGPTPVKLIRVIQPEHGDQGYASDTGAGDIETVRLIQQEAEGNSGSANLGSSSGAGGAVRTIVLRQDSDRHVDGGDHNGSDDDVKTIRIIHQENESSNGGYSGDEAESYGSHDEEEDPIDTLRSLQIIGVLRKK